MDPYLAAPSGWHPFDTKFVAALADQLIESLPPAYYAEIEHRTVLSVWEDELFVGQPDALVVRPGSSSTAVLASVQPSAALGQDILLATREPIHERYLEIRSQEAPQTVVAVVEVLSYSNTLPGGDRDRYLQKRGQIVASRTSLVEIDLLRAGSRMPGWDESLPYDYGVVAGPGYRRPHAKLYGFSLREEAITFPFPLDGGCIEPTVSLPEILATLYERGRYQMRIDYSRPPNPRFTAADEVWADALLRERGLR
jgi:hypothetical protein